MQLKKRLDIIYNNNFHIKEPLKSSPIIYIMNKKTKLAVFDIDGTIFRSNLHFELLDGLAYKGIFEKKALFKVIKNYRNWLDNRGLMKI